MLEKAKSGRDAFTFSLGGMRTIASFAIAPAIADDRINRIRDEHMEQRRNDQDRQPPPWMRRFRQSLQGSGA